MADRKMKIISEHRQPLSPISAARPPKTPRTPFVSKVESTKKAIENDNCGYDRFIPNRAVMDNDANHHHLISKENIETDEFQDRMKENLSSVDVESRILQMTIKAPKNKEGELNTQLLYTNSKPTPAKLQDHRFIPSAAEMILDAPAIINDYYLNLLDWGSTNLIAVALHDAVYLWDSQTGAVVDLFNQASNSTQLSDNIVITSLKWITEGSHLAIGLSDGSVQLWDTETIKRVRSMPGHPERVGTLAWNTHLLTSGCKSGQIHNHDVRIANHHTSTFNSHTQDVCGMEWSSDGKLLASGGNDNILNVWDIRRVTEVPNAHAPAEVDTPMISLEEHTSAVKAVAWCPWQRNILASGGGNADRHVRFWNTSNADGVCLKSVDTTAQVSNILWSSTYKEVICSYGKNMSIWQYSDMKLQRELTGHSERILSMVMAPDGQSVATAGADETLRHWKCFEPPKAVKRADKKAVKKGGASSFDRFSTIR